MVPNAKLYGAPRSRHPATSKGLHPAEMPNVRAVAARNTSPPACGLPMLAVLDVVVCLDVHIHPQQPHPTATTA